MYYYLHKFIRIILINYNSLISNNKQLLYIIPNTIIMIFCLLFELTNEHFMYICIQKGMSINKTKQINTI